MKRLILFIGFMVLSTAMYAQSWGASVDGHIQTYPQYILAEHNTPEAVEMIRNADTTNVRYQNYLNYLTGDYFYSFLYKNKFYMLSYDTCSSCFKAPSVEKPITRGLYLFRLNEDGWTKACYEPIQIDYYMLVSSVNKPNIPQHNIWSTYCYITGKKYISPNVKDGSVTVSADGEVTIVLINYSRYLESAKAIKNSYENKTVTLVQNDDEMYTIKK